MHNAKKIYAELYGYIHILTKDEIIAGAIVDVLIKIELPLQVFVTAVSIYKRIHTNPYELQKEILRCARGQSCHRSRGGTIPFADQGPHTQRSCHNEYIIMITCCVIASKYYRDLSFTNESWQCVTSTDYREINSAERMILNIIKYRISSCGEAQVLSEIRNFSEPFPKKSETKLRRAIRSFFCIRQKS